MTKTPNKNTEPSSVPNVNDAPFHVKLAIDLIMQLENHEIDEHEALKALEIVKFDLEQKIKNKQ
jgi:hypothetical protein